MFKIIYSAYLGPRYEMVCDSFPDKESFLKFISKFSDEYVGDKFVPAYEGQVSRNALYQKQNKDAINFVKDNFEKIHKFNKEKNEGIRWESQVLFIKDSFVYEKDYKGIQILMVK